MEFTQLMLITDYSAISAEEQAFLHCHKEIDFNGNMAADFIYRMTLNLKEMNDKKLYLAAGFESFGDYTKKAVGINERQAYNYMKILNELGENGLQSNAKLGVTKLALIAAADKEIQEELLQNPEIESATVKELKEKIEQLTEEINSKEEQISMLENEPAKIVDHSIEIEQIKAEAEKAKQIAENAKILKASALKRLEAEEEKAKQAAEDIKKLEAEVEKLKNAPPAEDKQSAEKVAAKEAEIAEKQKEIDALNKKLLIASDTDLTKFKFLFEQLNKLGAEMFEVINDMDNEKAEKCRNALKKIVEGWNL